MLSDIAIQCPACHETIYIEATELDGGSQTFVYDCEVCCRPMTISVRFAYDQDEAPDVRVESAN